MRRHVAMSSPWRTWRRAGPSPIASSISGSIGWRQAFATASAFLSSFIGGVILFCFTWALFHHMLGGIRHFIWDAGYGMDHPEREYLAQATLIGGIVLTVLVWIVAFIVR